MPRYFFHIKQDDQFTRDEEGVVLEDFDAVRGAVIESSREAVSEYALRALFEDGLFVVEDSDGRRVLQFAFKGTLPRTRL